MSVSIYIVQYHAPTKKTPHYWQPIYFTAAPTRVEARKTMRAWKSQSPGRYRVQCYQPTFRP